MAIYPTSEQIEALLADQDEGPVVMINLLRFKPRADASEGDISGEEAYRRYARDMIAFVQSKGARLIWSGRVTRQIIGSGGEDFESAALVEYPSRKVFVEIAMDPYVAGIGEHRAAGLEMQWLLASTTDTDTILPTG